MRVSRFAVSIGLAAVTMLGGAGVAAASPVPIGHTSYANSHRYDNGHRYDHHGWGRYDHRWGRHDHRGWGRHDNRGWGRHDNRGWDRYDHR